MMDARELHRALRVVAKVLDEGEHSHPPGTASHWLNVSVRDHAARAAVHLEKFLLNIDHGEDELAHACVRLLLALERRERKGAQK